jgi:hypothetical protein
VRATKPGRSDRSHPHTGGIYRRILFIPCHLSQRLYPIIPCHLTLTHGALFINLLVHLCSAFQHQHHATHQATCRTPTYFSTIPYRATISHYNHPTTHQKQFPTALPPCHLATLPSILATLLPSARISLLRHTSTFHPRLSCFAALLPSTRA